MEPKSCAAEFVNDDFAVPADVDRLFWTFRFVEPLRVGEYQMICSRRFEEET
jgi:hypothetical protein